VIYAKCNMTSTKCVECKQGSSPDCKYPKTYCDAAAFSLCKKHNDTNTWRGVNIAKGFKRGEWDFHFTEKSVTMTFSEMKDKPYKASKKDTGAAAVGEGVAFRFTDVPDGGPLNVKVNDVLTGMHVDADGFLGITKFMYLGLGAANGKTPASFDDAVPSWILVACKDPKSTSCDFSSVPSSTSALTATM
jgi:hypothetical protein